MDVTEPLETALVESVPKPTDDPVMVTVRKGMSFIAWKPESATKLVLETVPGARSHKLSKTRKLVEVLYAPPQFVEPAEILKLLDDMLWAVIISVIIKNKPKPQRTSDRIFIESLILFIVFLQHDNATDG